MSLRGKRAWRKQLAKPRVYRMVATFGERTILDTPITKRAQDRIVITVTL